MGLIVSVFANKKFKSQVVSKPHIMFEIILTTNYIKLFIPVTNFTIYFSS